MTCQFSCKSLQEKLNSRVCNLSIISTGSFLLHFCKLSLQRHLRSCLCIGLHRLTFVGVVYSLTRKKKSDWDVPQINTLRCDHLQSRAARIFWGVHLLLGRAALRLRDSLFLVPSSIFIPGIHHTIANFRDPSGYKDNGGQQHAQQNLPVFDDTQ